MNFDPPFSGSIRPPDVPPDPTGDEWRGEPGAPGAAGPQGPQGVPGPPGGLGEAPVDGAAYGRLNAAWAQVYQASNPSGYQTAAQVAASLSAYVPLAQVAAANGVASLDATGRVPTAQLPASATGTLTYRGAWNASTNTPTMASGALANGALTPANNYYVVSVGATTAAIDGITTWVAGDWIVSNGTIWQRVVNSTSPYLPLSGGSLSGALTAPSYTVTSSVTLIGTSRNPDVAFSWEDGTNNVGPYIARDGTLKLGALQLTSMAGNVGGTATLTLPSLTGTTAVNAPSQNLIPGDPRIGYPWSITDSAGNVAVALDANGHLYANITPPSSYSSLTIGVTGIAALDARQGDTGFVITDSVGAAPFALTTEGRTAFVPALGQIAAPAQGVVQRQTILTQSAPNISASIATNTVPTTYHAAITVESSGFDAVRLIFAVDNGAGAPFDTDIKAIVAVSAAPGDMLNPTDPTGAAAAWKTVTFNSNGLDVAWERQAGGSKTTQRLIAAPTVSSVDGSAQDALSGYTLSDWIPISSYDRTDGGRWPVLLVRTYGTGTGGPRARNVPQSATGWGNHIGDRFWTLYSQAGDFVSTPAGYAPGAANGDTILVGIQFYSRARGVSILSVGDSIVGGTGAEGGIAWGVRAAMQLSTPQAPVCYFFPPTGVVTGTSPAAWVTNAEGIVDAIRPGLTYGWVMSRNWTISQTNIDLLWQSWMKMAARVERMNGRLIFCAPTPCPGTYTSTTELLRKQIIARVAQCAAGANITFDMNQGMSQGVTPVDSYIAYYTDDQIHPNNHGHDAFTASVVKLIRGSTGV